MSELKSEPKSVGGSYLTPQSDVDSPLSTPSPRLSPHNFKYYNNHINKNQFNLILINASINLLKLLYPNVDVEKLKLKFFIIEILRRSKTSIQSLQICCYYLYKVVQNKELGSSSLPPCPKKLFLGMIILASKFNQDHNYSFKSWLKICGCKEDESYLNITALKNVEIQCLQSLDYNCYINGLKYENWCNVLVLFAYDFIKLHKVTSTSNDIVWDYEGAHVYLKLIKWYKFFLGMNDASLDSVKIQFSHYYNNQLGKKIIVDYSKPTENGSLSKKRSFATAETFFGSSCANLEVEGPRVSNIKKAKVACN